MKGWQIASIVIALMGIAFGVAFYIHADEDFASQLSVESELTNKEKGYINTTVRNFRHVVKRDYDKTVKEDVLKGWDLKWCNSEQPTPNVEYSIGCSFTSKDLKVMYVNRTDEDWPDILRHEIIHALIYASDISVNKHMHHQWMGRHNWCYGSGNCQDIDEIGVPIDAY